MLEDRRRELVVLHLPLVREIARRVARAAGLADTGDLEAYGLEGLLTAARRFRFGRGVKFATFASYRIRGAMIDGQRQRRWRTGDVEAPSGDAGALEALIDREACAELHRALATLVPREQVLLHEVYFKGKPVVDAAGAVGLSRWYASRLHASAVRQLRHALEARGCVS